MDKLLSFLQGKKTYITAILIAVYNVGIATGWWTPDNQIIIAVNGLLVAFGFGFLRSGVNNAVNSNK